MGTSLAPLAAFGGAALAVGFICYALWEPFAALVESFGLQFKRELDIGGVSMSPERFGTTLLALGIAIWAVLLVVTRPGIRLGVSELLGTALLVIYGSRQYVRMRMARTVKRFGAQLEGTLRQLAGAVRVGLGLRQAVVHVAEHSEEPTNRELTRIVGATNLGWSLPDALDELAGRVPTQETKMLARVIRVQSKTGSDLAGIFDSLADTIRDRRRLNRRISALTAQGRVSAWIVGLLPVVIFIFVMATQRDMREASLGTYIGRLFLAIGFGLDLLAAIVLFSITRIDV